MVSTQAAAISASRNMSSNLRRTQRAHRRVGLPLRGVRRSCAGMGDGRCGLLPRPITRQKGVNYAQASSVKAALSRPAWLSSW